APENGATVDHFEVEDLPDHEVYENNYVMLGKTGDAVQRRFNVPKPGEYLVRVRAFGQLWGPEPPKMELRLGDRILKAFDVAEEGKEREAARPTLAGFAPRAVRRPVASAEVNRLLRVYDHAVKDGDSFERSVQNALEAVLVSPHFLFRVELDPRTTTPGSTRP